MDEKSQQKPQQNGGDRANSPIAFWLAILAVPLFAADAIFAWVMTFTDRFPAQQKILEEHWAAMVAIPSASGIAFVLFVFLHQTDGPIESEAYGFKLKGASRQTVLWTICFLAISGALKLLW